MTAPNASRHTAAALFSGLDIAARYADKQRRRATPKNQKILDELLQQNKVIQEAAKKAAGDLQSKDDLYRNAKALWARFNEWIAALTA